MYLTAYFYDPQKQKLKVCRSLEEFKANGPTVVTTGTFDGLHIGHRRILDRVNELAKSINGQSVLLTFFPHPRMVLNPDDHGLNLLTTQNEKIRLLEETGLDCLVIHPFTKDFSRTSSTDYIRNILVVGLQTKKLVIGYDHHFGKNREGSFEHLVECGPLYGFDVEEISAQDIDDVAVSSTKVRRALACGDVNTAESYLGYPFELTGTVIEGDKLGRTIGFRTANISVKEDYKMIPSNGIYACIAHLGTEKAIAMVNIGVRPTVEGSELRIEAHLLDFEKDIYGDKLRLQFKHRLRQEVKFSGLEELKAQLEKDRAQTRSLLQ